MCVPSPIGIIVASNEMPSASPPTFTALRVPVAEELLAGRLFHERAQLLVDGIRHLHYGKGRGPDHTVVEERILGEADRAVAGVELRLRLEEDHDFAVARVRREAIPRLRVEVRGLLGNDDVQ
ncbi:hypothetical protein GCM10027057_12730 [Marisediminicola antarctica]